MLKMELELDRIDYDRIFNAYFEKARELLAESDDPAAGLLSRVPEGIAKTVWASMNAGQKEKVIASLLSSQLKKYIPEAEERLREKEIDLRVKNAKIVAE